MNESDLLKRVPPQNTEAEQSVLGAVLLDNESLDEIIDRSSPSIFIARAIVKSSAPCWRSKAAVMRSMQSHSLMHSVRSVCWRRSAVPVIRGTGGMRPDCCQYRPLCEARSPEVVAACPGQHRNRDR
jgi:hypothetical protein